jgi:hypothetical protein
MVDVMGAVGVGVVVLLDMKEEEVVVEAAAVVVGVGAAVGPGCVLAWCVKTPSPRLLWCPAATCACAPPTRPCSSRGYSSRTALEIRVAGEVGALSAHSVKLELRAC